MDPPNCITLLSSADDTISLSDSSNNISPPRKNFTPPKIHLCDSTLLLSPSTAYFEENPGNESLPSQRYLKSKSKSSGGGGFRAADSSANSQNPYKFTKLPDLSDSECSENDCKKTKNNGFSQSKLPPVVLITKGDTKNEPKIHHDKVRLGDGNNKDVIVDEDLSCEIIHVGKYNGFNELGRPEPEINSSSIMASATLDNDNDEGSKTAENNFQYAKVGNYVSSTPKPNKIAKSFDSTTSPLPPPRTTSSLLPKKQADLPPFFSEQVIGQKLQLRDCRVVLEKFSCLPNEINVSETIFDCSKYANDDESRKNFLSSVLVEDSSERIQLPTSRRRPIRGKECRTVNETIFSKIDNESDATATAATLYQSPYHDHLNVDYTWVGGKGDPTGDVELIELEDSIYPTPKSLPSEEPKATQPSLLKTSKKKITSEVTTHEYYNQEIYLSPPRRQSSCFEISTQPSSLNDPYLLAQINPPSPPDSSNNYFPIVGNTKHSFKKTKSSLTTTTGEYNSPPPEKSVRNRQNSPAADDYNDIFTLGGAMGGEDATLAYEKLVDPTHHPKCDNLPLPSLITEASKYGIKKLPKTKLVKILSAIYNYEDRIRATPTTKATNTHKGGKNQIRTPDSFDLSGQLTSTTSHHQHNLPKNKPPRKLKKDAQHLSSKLLSNNNYLSSASVEKADDIFRRVPHSLQANFNDDERKNVLNASSSSSAISVLLLDSKEAHNICADDSFHLSNKSPECLELEDESFQHDTGLLQRVLARGGASIPLALIKDIGILGNDGSSSSCCAIQLTPTKSHPTTTINCKISPSKFPVVGNERTYSRKCEVSARVLMNFLLQSPDIYRRILLYEPLWFDEVFEELNNIYLPSLSCTTPTTDSIDQIIESVIFNHPTDIGSVKSSVSPFTPPTTCNSTPDNLNLPDYYTYKKCPKKKLIQFLDSKCITFRFSPIQNWNHKPRKGRRR